MNDSKNYKKFVTYLSKKFNKPLLFPNIEEKRLLGQWEEQFRRIQDFCKSMKLKELILTDELYIKFSQRLEFYETSCDITIAIANFLNSPDIKKAMDDAGPYIFKDVSSQDQLVLVRLQYEGRINELEKTVTEQKSMLFRLRNGIEETKNETIVYDREDTDTEQKTCHEEEKEDLMSTRKILVSKA
mmetsp:Transcript_18971/g.16806  ORF Transcript_18971/g.16806 Transcript_18971/m.16806 type:complete len:186 (+) Transcript_18971:269-826(+)